MIYDLKTQARARTGGVPRAGPTGPKRAKQSQFAVGRRIGGLLRTNKANFGQPTGPSVSRTNKANSGARPIVRNKANSGRARPSKGRMRQTNPIPQARSCETKPISNGGLRIEDRPAACRLGPRGANCAKQTQFGPGQAGRAPAGANCAKQTQFSSAGERAKTPGRGQCAKQSQFWGSFKCRVSSVKTGKAVVGLQTSHFTLQTRPKAARAKQSQFPAGRVHLVPGGRCVSLVRKGPGG